jgi:cathepsin D
MGLSFPTLSTLNYTPIFDNIMQQHLLAHNMFSFYLTDKDEPSSSMILFGQPDNKYYEGELHWHNVTDPGYWQLEMNDIYLNNQPTGLCPDNKCKLVIDTGTSIMTGPTDSLSLLLQKLPLENCDEVDKLPELGFRIGNLLYTMKPREYIIFASKQTSSFIQVEDKKTGSQNTIKTDLSFTFEEGVYKAKTNSCKRAFMPLDVDQPRGPLWVWGDLIMRKYFIVFDRVRQMVGIAERKIMKSINT